MATAPAYMAERSYAYHVALERPLVSDSYTVKSPDRRRACAGRRLGLAGRNRDHRLPAVGVAQPAEHVGRRNQLGKPASTASTDLAARGSAGPRPCLRSQSNQRPGGRLGRPRASNRPE